MKTKTVITGLIITAFSITLVSSTALAGSKQRYRWEGVAIGIGAALLGHAIYRSHHVDRRPQVVCVQPEPSCPCHHGRKLRQGHWEWRKIWVPPSHERIWNPGHYTPNGQWVVGHWMEMKTQDGHWAQEKVWIPDHHGPY